MEKLSGAIDYLVAHYHEQPELDNIAAQFGYEPTYFQKLFQDHVGLSPKKFVQYMSMKTAKDFLLKGGTTLDAAYEAGLSGNGRLHDLFVTCEAATPGEIKNKGHGLTLRYGACPTPFGELFVAKTDRGICWLSFQMDGNQDRSIARLHKHWQNADLIEDKESAKEIADDIVAIWSGAANRNKKTKLHLFGTNFQVQVWQALLKIPSGSTVSYGAIAQSLGKPDANRAVGTAVGANPISLLIPCHRVIQSTGIIENYAWGSERKKALLGAEMASLKKS